MDSTWNLWGRVKSSEVDSIRDHRKRGKGYQYLVEWKGYSNETWEPESNLKNATKILQEYKKRKNLQ